MRIYSMTATFGKLNRETLTLKPGLNVIHAPNEWGKSTWCAFLTAMLYGLDTRSHSTKNTLSDKERYTPWSGTPMAGWIDLSWNGRDITIERRTKGRLVFGDFRAYETASGLPVPELTAQNCGHLLLGVEKTVFTRSAMIRLTDLPVTQDEALRRRLNALVTTGDDSGTGDDLERRLRDLKNRCRYHRTGLLPQAEAEAAELDRKLRDLEALENQSRKLRQRCAALEEQLHILENHRTALAYHTAQENARRLQAAQEQFSRAEQALYQQKGLCVSLPDREQARNALDELQDLQNRWTQLRLEYDSTDAMPEHPLFHGLTAEAAQEKVDADIAQFQKLRKWHPLSPILGILAVIAGVTTCILAPNFRIYGIAAVAAGFLATIVWAILILLRRRKANRMAAFYGSRHTALWIASFEDYVNLTKESNRSAEDRQAILLALRKQIQQACHGQTLADTLAYWQQVNNQWDALYTAQAEFHRQADHRNALLSFAVDAPAPQAPDELTLSESHTRQALADTARELRELQHRLGQCQGQMEAIGHRTALEAHRNALYHRIRQLEDTYAALTLALTTLENARATLQRRFAPRITGRAQELLCRLTEGRYDRLLLGSDMTLHATARDEDTLRNALWRSDGTADLLYLALRLAVAGELTPDAPLILDDALVRFDDVRLERTMAVLKEEASHRQILLFTCHTRESQYV